ncbi:unnamed protein product [Wickerhamomyces anomalus]
MGDEDEDDEEDDGFLKKKVETESESKPKRVLPNPEEDEEKFLQEFAAQHAWIPQKGDKIINLDNHGEEEDDEEFDDAVEQFEHAYNHRYEDPSSAEIISYARNAATVRRDTNSHLVKRISDSLLDKDFDDSQWDTLLQELFNDEFYNDDASKPQWDEDDEIMKDFKPSGADDEDEEEQSEAEEADEEPAKKKSKKDQLKEKKDKKRKRNGRSKEKKDTFKYREVSPETFGLTTRDILVADDLQLNEYVGLKKYAAYRPKDQRVKDRRKLAKAKQLKEWRKKVFKNENGPEVDENDKEGDIKIPIPADVEKKSKKSRKRKHEKLMD